MAMYIFLDESGDFSSSDQGTHFVLASFTIGDPKRIKKAFRSWCSTRFPRKMRGQAEIKWSATGIDSQLRVKTLRRIASLDVRIRYLYFKKKNIPSKFKNRNDSNEKVHGGLLYTNIVGELIEAYFPPSEKEIFIICDNRKLKGFSKMEFKNHLMGRLLPNLPKGTRLEIEMIDSTTNCNIQIVDWIVGAISTYHEGRKEGDQYFEAIRNNLISEGRELFADEQPY